jgi:hypothetical protein
MDYAPVGANLVDACAPAIADTVFFRIGRVTVQQCFHFRTSKFLTRSSTFRTLPGQRTMLKSDVSVSLTSSDEYRYRSYTVEVRFIMLSATSRGQRLCPVTTTTPRSAFSAVLLTALASICSHTAFAQMEHRNAVVHTQQMATAAPAAAAAAAAPNPDCTLILPEHPLTAKGLATPFQLTATDPNGGPCNEANTAQSAFVEAAVFNPANSQISIYHPLVIDMGTKPAIAPVVPTLPANATVALWIGFNGDNLTLTAADPNTLSSAKCVNGLPGSIFTQISYCNAPAFFNLADNAAINGTIKVPALATAKDGQTCPTIRSFSIVDQDQSDNTDTLYLATSSGTTAQNTKANIKALQGATTLVNPGDNALFSYFVAPAIGCTPWLMPSLDDPGQMVPSEAVNELQAHLLQKTPVARVPGGDPMAEFAGEPDLSKDNLYRAGVDQPAATYQTFQTAPYCREMLRALPKMALDQKMESNFASLAPAAANNTFTFLAQRWVASWQLLNCQSLINLAAPISLTTNANTGVVTAATINTTKLNSEISSIAGSLDSDNAIYSN